MRVVEEEQGLWAHDQAIADLNLGAAAFGGRPRRGCFRGADCFAVGAHDSARGVACGPVVPVRGLHSR